MASDIQTNLAGAEAPYSEQPLGDVILKTEGLTKYYGGVHALVDCNFEIRKGEHVAITAMAIDARGEWIPFLREERVRHQHQDTMVRGGEHDQSATVLYR